MNRNSLAFYDGPSELDGKPIISIATGYRTMSNNRKTGPMLQVYIFTQSAHPYEASKTGADVSVCGHCRLREIYQGRGQALPCYVDLIRGAGGVWRSWRAGNIRTVTPAQAGAMAPFPIRQGAYGDPAAVPSRVWRDLEARSRYGGTSYTHQWAAFPAMAEWAMASIDPKTHPNTLRARAEAHALGFRTYRLLDDGEEPQPGEIMCPFKELAIQCAPCGLCGGNRRAGARDIVTRAV